MTPFPSAVINTRESIATLVSIPVPTKGASAFNNGTACRIMFDPINARFASSCSRKGIKEAAIEAIWLGAISIKATSSRGVIG